ncbi:hypothetical protein CPJCM30710_08380 [Clostridium polyendosporum]|uniref:Transposase n=1 Tax=Clostridium polyendosporum TaxID=69208 RepID=A0A919VFI0_9CLOT|nr:transposase [Clostridium polyendosporum]GIM28172.1 hypothetical protein CPJCM30710_08380 [Clostridium polyendosporum]
MAKNAPSYVLNLKLETELFQEDILDVRFEIGRKLYNSVLGVGQNRYIEMIKTKTWRENQKNIADVYKVEKDLEKAKKLCKPYFKIRKDLQAKYSCTEYSLHEVVKTMQHHYKRNLDSFTCQKIASRVWTALDKVLFGDGEKLHFKKYNQGLNSLEGKTNGTGIRYKLDTHTLEWNGLVIKVQSKLNDYEINALRDKVKYCRIIRRFVREKFKYVLQLVLEGIPPLKIEKGTGRIKTDIGLRDCGIDIGTQTIAYTTDSDSKLLELAPRVQNIENEKRKLLRYMDRSKRAANPNNFNEDGTVRKGVKLEWNFSKKYIKARNVLKDLYRKQADIRRQDHNIMANEIINQCDTAKVETMCFKGLQKRTKETKISKKTGKINRKKRFGKSLANKAPSMFLTILENKLKVKGGLYEEVNTYEVKASQYNHLNRQYSKKKLSQRWNYFEYNGKKIKVQRDIYSSYLIKNVKQDLNTIDNELCIKDFEKFLELHNKEIDRLSALENLSSIGI